PFSMTQTPSRPNLVLFMPDEMRADALASYGNPVSRTPNFDRLAAEGVRFSNCHVQFPVCGASRCSLLTGWPAHVRGHRSLYYFLRPDEPNLFRDLRTAGYDVYWFGKNDALAAASFAGSVTEWRDRSPPMSAETLALYLGGGLTPGATTMLFPASGDRRGGGDFANVQAAIRFLERREAERPFCLFLALSQPHPPYRAPDGFHDLYGPDDLPPLVPPGLPMKPAFHAALRGALGVEGISERVLRQVRAVYLGQVAYSDWLLGELMEALERTGRGADTALFVASDHGDYAGDYGLIEKWPAGLEDCLTHTPLIVRAPGRAAGHVVDEMVELFDLMPTMLELAGGRATHAHFARSLVPQLHGRAGEAGRAAFTEGGYNPYEPQAFEPLIGGIYGPKTRLQNELPATVARCASVRTKTHRLIHRPGGQSELYDCAADPGLTRNLIDDPSAAGARGALTERLLTWAVNTAAAPPPDKDARGLPPFLRTPDFGE
ncbi:MAG: sulfatase-like hydrolase/transferase, partial [Caulobacteraceae bacterium]